MSKFSSPFFALGVFVLLFGLSACPEHSTEDLDASTTQDAFTSADAQAIVDAAGQCSSASECATGQGCHEGICAACQSADDCRTELHEGCNGGVCGPCSDANQCAAGLGCRAATGECKSCRSSQECRTGEGCVDGVCGACSEAADCAGALCTDGTCIGCVPGDDDDTCQALFDDPGMYCRDDGRCGPSLCASGLDCVILQEVCDPSSSRCRACNNSQDCLDENMGGYGAGTLCVDGACLEANCADSSSCPEDSPVCGNDHRCRACQIDQECLDREGVNTGYVCDVERGRCAEGDCYPAGEACGEAAAGQICGDDFNCAACDNNSQCDQAYSSNHLCMDGQCEVAECNLELLCADERVCDDGSCVDCTSEDQSYCLTRGLVCDASNHACVACSTSPECGNGYVCVSGTCVEGQCAIPNEVNPFNPCQYCDGATHLWIDKPEGTRCGDCKICRNISVASNEDAGMSEDAGSAIDAGPQAVEISCEMVESGEDPNNDCTQNCQACDGYGECQWALAGTDPNDDCQASSLASCGFDGLCQGGNDKCSYWDAADGIVDDGNECTTNDHCDGQGGVTGDKVANKSPCRSGTKICFEGECIDCRGPSDCTQEGQVCSGGNCVTGNCSQDGDCQGEVPQCNTWTCDSNHTCQPSPVGSGTPCDINPCTTNDKCIVNSDGQGECVEADNPIYLACTPENGCTESNVPCHQMSCVPNNGERTWVDVAQVDGESCDEGIASCLGGGTCNTESQCVGYDVNDNACYIDSNCYGQDYSGGTVGNCEKKCDHDSNDWDWTVANDKCIIDGQCYAANQTNPVNVCQYCGAQDYSWADADSIRCDSDSDSVCEQRCNAGSCEPRWKRITYCGSHLQNFSCIKDMTNDLRWKVGALSRCPTAPQPQTFNDAADFCAGIGSYWRLPYKNEISSLLSVDTACSADTCNTSGGNEGTIQASSLFDNSIVHDGYYWIIVFENHIPSHARGKFNNDQFTVENRTPLPEDKAYPLCVYRN